MSYIRYTTILAISVLFSSCTAVSENITWTGLVLMGVALMGVFIFMFYLIIKRKQRGQRSLAQFSQSIQTMLDKFEHTESRIGALQTLIERIMQDQQYKKDVTWRNQVLARTYLYMATEYHHMGDMHNTLNTCDKILELTPDDAMTLYNRGSMLLNDKEYEKALADLNRSIELVDNYGSSYNNRGTVLNKLGKYEEALADFDQALALEESVVIHYNKANTLREMKNFGGALESYQKALSLCDEEEEDLKKEISDIIKSLPQEK